MQSGPARGPVKAEIAGSNPVGTATSYLHPRLERWPSPVEGDGLENRYRGNPIVGSNPTLSARFVFEIRSSLCDVTPKDASPSPCRVPFVCPPAIQLTTSTSQRSKKAHCS